MAGTNPDVAVTLSAKTQQFQSEFKKASRKLGEFGKQSREATKKIAKIGAAAAAAGALIAATLFKQSAAAAKEIKNLSQISGVGAEQFQKLTFAAKEYGIEQDKVSDILKDTNDKVGDFLQTGGGALADYFENIAPLVGQTADEFKNLSSDQVLQKYVNGLEQANVSQSEMTFYMEAIASDATMLLPLLRNNGEEFQKVAADVDKFNLALSDVEVEQLAQVNESFTKMAQTTKMFINKVMASFAPVIQVVIDKFQDLTSSNIDYGKTAIKVFKTVATAVGFLGDAIRGIEAVFKGLKVVFNTVVVGITQSIIGLLELVNKVSKTVVESQNVLIRGLNKIPKVNIDELVVGDIEAIEKLKNFQEFALGGMADSVDAFHETMMKPLPSELVDGFLDEVQRASDEAAKIRLNATKEIQSNGSGKPDALAAKLLSEEEQYKNYYERRQAAQEEANKNLLEDHKLTLDTQAQLDEMDAQRRRDFVSGTSKMFGDLSSLMSSENKRLFNIGKAAAIAQASIDGIAAAVSSYKFGAAIGGPLLGGAFAVASGVATGAMISQIASQQFGGGAKTANVSTAAPSTASAGANAGQTLTVQGLDSGALFDGNAVSDLADRLLDFQRDGGRVVLGA